MLGSEAVDRRLVIVRELGADRAVTSSCEFVLCRGTDATEYPPV